VQSFTSLAEVEAARLTPDIKRVVLRCVQNLVDGYGPDFDLRQVGGVVVLDQDTTDRHALELFGRTWIEGRYEGVTYHEEGRCFVTCVLFNNEEGVTIVVPDAPWLDPRLRKRLTEELVAGPAT